MPDVLSSYYQGVGKGWKIGGKTYMSSVMAESALGIPQKKRYVSGQPQQQQLNIQSLLTQYQEAETQARAENLKKYEQAMALAEKGVARFQPGGAFEKAGLAQIEAAKVKGVGAETQKLVSAGLYGSTMGAGVERAWEEDVGAKARLTLESILQEKLTGAERFKTGVIERREDPYPNYAALMQALQATYSVG